MRITDETLEACIEVLRNPLPPGQDKKQIFRDSTSHAILIATSLGKLFKCNIILQIIL